MRVDVMAKMRNVEAFEKLWRRRTTMTLPDGVQCELMSLPDLIKAKKTQRDKDWPMVRRLVEVNYFVNRDKPTSEQIVFWFLELRTPELLTEIASLHRSQWRKLIARRPILALAIEGAEPQLTEALLAEEWAERLADREYWAPLRAELEKLRLARVRSRGR
jgi:hypothetical protein